MRRWWKRLRFRREWKHREYVAFISTCAERWDRIRVLNDLGGVWKK